MGKNRSKIEENRSLLNNKGAFPKLRLLASTYAEIYYIFQNFLDHIIDFGETTVLGQKYLPERMKAYKGEKKIAFIYHGYFQGTVGNERLERVLGSKLFNIFAISGTYQPYSQDIRKSAQYEMRVLEWILNNSDAEEVYIIGHSQGGLVARYMIQFLGADKYIDKAIFLSTPHQGTKFAYTNPINIALMKILKKVVPRFPKTEGESAKQMKPGSKFIRRLNSKELPKNIEYTSIYSYFDPVVLPSSNGRLPYKDVNNILLWKIGHMQTLYDFQSIELILKALLIDSKDGENLDLESLIDPSQIFKKRKVKGDKGDYDEIISY